MQLDARFVIDGYNILSIQVPSLEHKENYYYQPTSRLHIFDVATLSYHTDDTCMEILEDSLETVLRHLYCPLHVAIYKSDDYHIIYCQVKLGIC